jgi:hypothetical protein
MESILLARRCGFGSVIQWTESSIAGADVQSGGNWSQHENRYDVDRAALLDLERVKPEVKKAAERPSSRRSNGGS